jgi:hypothetical protein
MRVIPFLLVTLVFVVAFGNYLIAPTSVANAPEKTITNSVSGVSSDLASKEAFKTFSASPVSLSSGPVNPSAAAAGAPSVACIHRADGATICGPVVGGGSKAATSPFDQPGLVRPSVSPRPHALGQPTAAAPAVAKSATPAVKLKVAHRQSAHEPLITPKQVFTPPIPRESETPLLKQASHDDAQPTHVVRNVRPFPKFERTPPSNIEQERASPRQGRESVASLLPFATQSPRHVDANLLQLANQNERAPMLAERQAGANRYDPERRSPPMLDHKPPPRFSSANVARLANERERAAIPPDQSRPTVRYSSERRSPASLGRAPNPANFASLQNERERPMARERERAKYNPGANSDSSVRPNSIRMQDAKFADFDRRALALQRELRTLRAEHDEALRHLQRLNARKPIKPPSSKDKTARYE